VARRTGGSARTGGDDDNALVVAARGGDRSALDELLRRHFDRIYGVCRRLAGNDADALDATQEALLSVVRGLPGFDGRAAFSTWCYRVATNACLDELRRRARRPRLIDPEDERLPVPSAGGAPGLEQTMVDRLAIDDALLTLPEEFRAAVVLRDLCRLDYGEIAEVLGIPAGTVRSRISRGRAALSRRLGGNPSPATDRPTARP
jgi:RNA polymerase sigma-70 factor, ECF subfamily